MVGCGRECSVLLVQHSVEHVLALMVEDNALDSTGVRLDFDEFEQTCCEMNFVVRNVHSKILHATYSVSLLFMLQKPSFDLRSFRCGFATLTILSS